jgi:hypothetical protein
VRAGIARSRIAEDSARTIARSAAGSVMRTPPTVETKTSWLCSGSRTRLATTACTIETRPLSRPWVARRGVGECVAVTSACTSASRGRRPSSVTVTQVPAATMSVRDRNSPLGSASPTMPVSDRSKQPISSVGP